MTPRSRRALSARLQSYCRTKLSPALSQEQLSRLERYVLELVEQGLHAPTVGRGIAWTEIAEATEIPLSTVRDLSPLLRPAFDAIARALPNSGPRLRRPRPVRSDRAVNGRSSKLERSSSIDPHERARAHDHNSPPAKRGPKPRPIIEFPEPISKEWTDVPGFAAALRLHMTRHGDTLWSLHRAVTRPGETFDRATLKSWRNGDREPRTLTSHDILSRIERRYGLPPGYFTSKLGHPGRAATEHTLAKSSQQRRLAWHLPTDFERRPLEEQAEILDWVQSVIVSGSTEYRRYQAAASKHRFGLRFPASSKASGSSAKSRSSVLDAPPRLAAEMLELLAFKTAPLTALGYQRNGVWGSETAAQKVEHLSLMFGALAADPRSPVHGLGVERERLSFGQLVFPSVWNWYLRWRFERRGFYTAWELDMLVVAMSLVRKDWGWIRQTPRLAEGLDPIPGLVSEDDVAAAQADWSAACDRMFDYARATSREVKKLSKVHRDPFEPVLPVLEAASPLKEYLKIADEIVRLMPSTRSYPKAAAEAVRSLLMLRLGLHLGIRQRNLRQLLVCPKGMLPRSERALADQRRGELRWRAKDGVWEVLIPAAAFKNAESSFFGGKPFRLSLPDVGGLYRYVDDYLDHHRPLLLGDADDPGTFFIKSKSARTRELEYDQTTFYEAWRLIIQRYGIYNPYTGRGAIEGLLPHGPHNVRDVLATHVLKQTGSYQQASYAIQDTPEMVAKHYGRFLPEDKAAMAAQILNQVWDAA